MTKRLQVLVDDDEFVEFQRAAKRQRLTMSEWVRQSLRKAKDDANRVEAKLRAIAEASKINGPTADIEVMLREIEQRKQHVRT